MIAMAQHFRFKIAALAVLVLLLTTVAAAADQKSVEALKAEAEKATGGHQARLYAELARDISVKTRGKMKETEIHLRNAERRLDAVRRTLSVDDRPPLEDAGKKLERFRQDLLNAMFVDPKKEKKP